jgi:hypothetical protein
VTKDSRILLAFLALWWLSKNKGAASAASSSAPGFFDSLTSKVPGLSGRGGGFNPFHLPPRSGKVNPGTSKTVAKPVDPDSAVNNQASANPAQSANQQAATAAANAAAAQQQQQYGGGSGGGSGGGDDGGDFDYAAANANFWGGAEAEGGAPDDADGEG